METIRTILNPLAFGPGWHLFSWHDRMEAATPGRQEAETGQGLAEYALILALIAIVAIGAVGFFGAQVIGLLASIGVDLGNL